MKQLHLIIHDAAAFGDYDPAMRREAARKETVLRGMTVDELVAGGYGWVTDGPLSRDEIVNTYNRFRSEEITEEQAAQHERARVALGID